MTEERRKHGEQRNDVTRRMIHDLDYFMSDGTERRSFKERRSGVERRSEWMRIGKWISVFARALGYRK